MRRATRPSDAGRLERAVERSQKKVQPAVDALYMGLPAERVVTRIPKQSTCQPAAFAASDAIVILRHGRTEHNKLGLFTGWEDASLAKEGIAEAKRAGQLLRAHGFAVDAVYTSDLRVISERFRTSSCVSGVTRPRRRRRGVTASRRRRGGRYDIDATPSTRRGDGVRTNTPSTRPPGAQVVALAGHRDGLARLARVGRALGADHQELAAQRAHVRRPYGSQQEGDPGRARRGAVQAVAVFKRRPFPNRRASMASTQCHVASTPS